MAPNSDKPNGIPLKMAVYNSKNVLLDNDTNSNIHASVNLKIEIRLIGEEMRADLRALIEDIRSYIERKKQRKWRDKMRRRFLLHRPRRIRNPDKKETRKKESIQSKN